MTVHWDRGSTAAELLKTASATLGRQRAEQLRDALTERAAQFVRVAEAS